MASIRTEKQYDKVRWQTQKEAESLRNRAYREANSDRLKAQYRIKAEAQRAANPSKVRAYNIARKHGERLATPAWASHQAMGAVYKMAANLQATDGIKRHVDHIIPLKHPLVCGLHCEANLQVLPAHENMAKHNKFQVSL